MNQINNTEVDNGKDVDVVMVMYNFIKHSEKFSKISRKFWH